jgi:hypothetical protein
MVIQPPLSPKSKFIYDFSRDGYIVGNAFVCRETAEDQCFDFSDFLYPNLKISTTSPIPQNIINDLEDIVKFKPDKTPIGDRIYFFSLKALYWILLPIMIVKNFFKVITYNLKLK